MLRELTSNRGSLHVRVGSMFSGKTTYLIRIIESLGRANKILYINHSLDTRNSLGISTHSLTDLSLVNEYADIIQVQNLSDISDETLNAYFTVCIDEGQFFSDLKAGVLHMVEELNKEVYVVGLKGDYKRGKFGYISDLLEISDSFSTLETNTLCDLCIGRGARTPALFTHRLQDSSGQQIEIGADSYIPVCRSCYIEKNK